MADKVALKTDWVKIGTSGKTVDGRDISAQFIADMAENYDPGEYTAVINYEHYSWMGNFGSVLELKSEKNGKGEACLLAVIEPNKHMLQMNSEGQKMFTSMEIMPNFADTGKAYLSGLALTDSPASRGTTQLKFSKRVPEGRISSNPEEFNFSLQEIKDEQPDSKTAEKFFVSLLKKAFPNYSNNASEGADNPNEDEEMTKEQLAKFTTDMATTLGAQIDQKIDEKFAAITKASGETVGDGEGAESESGDSDSAVFSNEQGKALGEQVAALSGAVEKISENLSKALGNPTGKDTEDHEGSEEFERVL